MAIRARGIGSPHHLAWGDARPPFPPGLPEFAFRRAATARGKAQDGFFALALLRPPNRFPDASQAPFWEAGIRRKARHVGTTWEAKEASALPIPSRLTAEIIKPSAGDRTWGTRRSFAPHCWSPCLPPWA